MQMDDSTAGLALMGWVVAGLLLLVSVICFGAARGTIALNSFVGLRVPALTRNDEAWRAGHAAGQIPALVAFVIALVFDALGPASSAFYWGAIAAFLAGLTWTVIRAKRAADAS